MMIDEITEKNVREWLEGNYDRESKEQVRHLKEENSDALVDAFYKRLSFGTGGLRGVMGVGTNRMNVYTVRSATQGFANYLSKNAENKDKLRIIIGYDSRQNSHLFAVETAKVLAANNIEALLFENLRPTPLVSFGCRYKKCSGGIMITASHNPPQYNGYKVYWEDGGQVVSPHDQGIIDEVNAITSLSMVNVADSINHPLIQTVNGEIQEAYYDTVSTLQCYPEANRKNGHLLKIAYSNLHGTGITMIPETLERWGFTNILPIEEQSEPDGGFPTVTYPNPEEPKAMELGIRKMLNENADILIATDPDADRMGVAVAINGEAHLLTGNEIACLCLEHLCSSLQAQGRMPERAVFVKTVVTTELFQAIADFYNKPCFNVLTGFKYIAQLIRQWEMNKEEYQFIFGAEESYGYLLGTQGRDKDGVVSSALISEVALHAKLQGKTLIDRLHDMYKRYGVYVERLHAIKFPESKQGHEQMKNGMNKLRKNPPEAIFGVPVVTIEDYSTSIKRDLRSGRESEVSLPKTELMAFWLSDGSKVMVRPSGTEPKVKIYCGVVKQPEGFSIEDTRLICENYCQNLIDDVVAILRER